MPHGFPPHDLMLWQRISRRVYHFNKPICLYVIAVHGLQLPFGNDLLQLYPGKPVNGMLPLCRSMIILVVTAPNQTSDRSLAHALGIPTHRGFLLEAQGSSLTIFT